jgi:2-dehydro-3-deoxygluconokinase
MAAVVCFGELLIRLSAPGRELLLQSPRLNVHVGGAEANVAVALAQFGRDARMASVVPENALGEAAIGELRRYRIDVSHVARRPGRMGLYFLTPGAVRRPSSVLYDRRQSAFAEAAPSSFDWARILDGAEWLHLSGVTPAIGRKSADAAISAVKAARAQGLKISFDGNYRSQIWKAWDGEGPAILKEIINCATIAFVNEKDIALILKRQFPGDAGESRRNAFAAAFDAFPSLERIASTMRIEHSVDHHELSGVILSRQLEARSKTFVLDGIVDRIGAGDAFAAGIIYGVTSGRGEQYAIDFAVAAAALKHSVPGDFLIASAADVETATVGDDFSVRR